MTNEQAISELITEVKIITQALQEIQNYIAFIDKRVTALEAKHGHWREKIIDSHSYAECSECKTVYSWSETETMRFCKRCGAKMDEVKE